MSRKTPVKSLPIVRRISPDNHWTELPIMIQLMKLDKARASRVRKDYYNKLKVKNKIKELSEIG